jgi:hypothetical protein
MDGSRLDGDSAGVGVGVCSDVAPIEGGRADERGEVKLGRSSSDWSCVEQRGWREVVVEWSVQYLVRCRCLA